MSGVSMSYMSCSVSVCHVLCFASYVLHLMFCQVFVVRCMLCHMYVKLVIISMLFILQCPLIISIIFGGFSIIFSLLYLLYDSDSLITVISFFIYLQTSLAKQESLTWFQPRSIS